MTNLFPKESLEKARKNNKDCNVANKVINQIENAQKNYEIRYLLLSVWARINPEAISYKKMSREEMDSISMPM